MFNKLLSVAVLSLVGISTAVGMETSLNKFVVDQKIEKVKAPLIEVSSLPEVRKLLSTNDSKDYSKAASVLMKVSEDHKIRILITFPDGTVAFDSSKGQKNTYSAMKSKEINENHNTRVAVLLAQMLDQGFAWEEKLSTSTNNIETYVATRIGPIGRSQGTLRVSKKTEV